MNEREDTIKLAKEFVGSQQFKEQYLKYGFTNRDRFILEEVLLKSSYFSNVAKNLFCSGESVKRRFNDLLEKIIRINTPQTIDTPFHWLNCDRKIWISLRTVSWHTGAACLRDLIGMKAWKMAKLRNLSQRSVDAIQGYMTSFGISLDMSPKEPKPPIVRCSACNQRIPQKRLKDNGKI